MNPDTPPPDWRPADLADGEGELLEVHIYSPDSQESLADRSGSAEAAPAASEGKRTTTYVYAVRPRRPIFDFEHDQDRRVFRLTDADGRTEVFRDNPTRYLLLEPDLVTGEMRPVTKKGRPVYLYLSREEREIC